MIIRDPATGQALLINADGQGVVRATVQDEAHYVNEEVEEAYVALISSDPSAAAADFFYLKNDSEYDLIIYKIKGWVDNAAAGPVTVTAKTNVTGSPDTPSTITPVNMTAGSGNKADCTAYQRDGVMNLTGGDILDNMVIDNATIGEQIFDFPAGIRLKKNATLIFNNDIDPVSYAIKMSVYFYFHKPKSAA